MQFNNTMAQEELNEMFEYIRQVQYNYLDIPDAYKTYHIYHNIYKNNIPITFLKHKYTIRCANDFLLRAGDVIIGFYADVDVEFDLVLAEINAKVKYKLKANEFMYSPDILYRFYSYLKAEKCIEIWAIYGYLHRNIAHTIRNIKIISEMCKGEYLNYIDYKPILSHYLYIPPLYFEQKEHKRLRREFIKEDGLQDELLATVWHPDNYSKFKDLNP